MNEFYLCRDLFQLVKNVELREPKASPVIKFTPEDKDIIFSHLSECEICKMMQKNLIKNINPLDLLKVF